jgi:hypothetical protein
MDDLISRSKLLKEIETWGGCVEALHEYISNMPTAYDVDDVIAELKKESYQEWCDSPKIVELKDAIDIVRNAGKEVRNE